MLIPANNGSLPLHRMNFTLPAFAVSIVALLKAVIESCSFILTSRYSVMCYACLRGSYVQVH
jgi:hypothetical protein